MNRTGVTLLFVLLAAAVAASSAFAQTEVRQPALNLVLPPSDIRTAITELARQRANPSTYAWNQHAAHAKNTFEEGRSPSQSVPAERKGWWARKWRWFVYPALGAGAAFGGAYAAGAWRHGSEGTMMGSVPH